MVEKKGSRKARLRATTKPRTFSRGAAFSFTVISCRSKQFNMRGNCFFVSRLWYACIMTLNTTPSTESSPCAERPRSRGESHTTSTAEQPQKTV